MILVTGYRELRRMRERGRRPVGPVLLCDRMDVTRRMRHQFDSHVLYFCEGVRPDEVDLSDLRGLVVHLLLTRTPPEQVARLANKLIEKVRVSGLADRGEVLHGESECAKEIVRWLVARAKISKRKVASGDDHRP
jgi:hypothetical protein